MQTTMNSPVVPPLTDGERHPFFVLVASVLFALVLAAGGLYLSGLIAGLDNATQFGNLGRPVQEFFRFAVLAPGLLALVSAVLMALRRPIGRYLTMAVMFITFVMSIAALLQVVGVFFLLEGVVDAIMASPWIALMLPVAYVVFWFAGRFEEGSLVQRVLTQGSLIAAVASVVLLILSGKMLESANAMLDQFGRDQGRVTGAVVLVAVIVLTGILTWRLIKIGEYFGENHIQRSAWQGWLMLSPNAIGFMLFFAGPLLLSLYLSFTNSSVGRTPEIIGFENYTNILSLEFHWRDNVEATRQSLLSVGYAPLVSLYFGGRELVIGAKDVLFWRSMFNTFLFCLMLLPLAIIPAIFLALILNSKLPGVKFYRAVYFLPSVASVVGVALIWRWLYDPLIGFFNYFITLIVNFFNGLLGLGLADPQIRWLTEPSVVLFAVVLLAAWQVVGFNTVLFLAGLQGIPVEMYEAAGIDGANRAQRFRFVTLPLLAPTTFFVVITTAISGLQVFNEPYSLFPYRPIPIEATTAVYYLYDRGFPRAEFGYSSALAWILFVIIFLITLIQFRMSRSNAYE
jgi:ABC-type sugar transport system permease subunit